MKKDVVPLTQLPKDFFKGFVHFASYISLIVLILFVYLDLSWRIGLSMNYISDQAATDSEDASAFEAFRADVAERFGEHESQITQLEKAIKLCELKQRAPQKQSPHYLV